jgi:hypothetical protein
LHDPKMHPISSNFDYFYKLHDKSMRIINMFLISKIHINSL